MNELDRAIAEALRTPSAMPALYRALCEGELWALVPFHPEIEDEMMELKKGMNFPFVQLQDEKGVVVPIFSSEARVDEGLEKGKVPPRTYCAAAMPAEQLLEIIGQMEWRAVLNKSCATGTLILPANLLRDLASGVALQPRGLEEKLMQQPLALLDPADYPTDLLQPLFEILRRHREFRAAWFFRDDAVEKEADFQLLVYMDPRDATIFHDLSMTLSAAAQGRKVGIGFVPEDDPAYLARLFQSAPPFFVAADFGAPPSEAES